MRLDDNSSCPTLVPGHSNFPVHPYEHRSISVREAAYNWFSINYNSKSYIKFNIIFPSLIRLLTTIFCFKQKIEYFICSKLHK